MAGVHAAKRLYGVSYRIRIMAFWATSTIRVYFLGGDGSRGFFIAQMLGVGGKPLQFNCSQLYSIAENK